MSDYVDILTDFFVYPPRAAETSSRERPLSLGVWCFLFTGLSLFLAQSLARRVSWMSPGPVSLVLFCFWQILAGFLWTAVFHMMVEIGRGQKKNDSHGNAVGLFVLLGLSDLVWISALPMVLILKLMSWDHAIWFTILFWGLGFANLTLKARSIKNNYGISSAASWTVVVIPYAILAALVVALISLALAGVVFSLMRLFS